jgi:hypothetical protein
MDIGPLPTTGGSCATWRTTYFKDGQKDSVKDYRLCRSNDNDDLYIDEGNDVLLACQWLGDVLITPFTYDATLFVVRMRLTGPTLEDELLMIDPPHSIGAIQSLKTRLIQRTVLERADV